jgi:hypothetical protein
MDVHSRIAGLGERFRAATGGVPTFGAARRCRNRPGYIIASAGNCRCCDCDNGLFISGVVACRSRA